MKFSVLNTKCVFNEKEGTTTYTLLAALNPGPISMDDPTIKRIVERYGFDSMGGVIEVRGIAHLKPQDTWDPTIGRKVAEVKCYFKLFSKITRMNVDIADYTKFTLDNDISKYLDALVNEKQYFQSFCDD